MTTREDHVKKQIVIGAMMALTMIVLMAVAPPAGPEIFVAPADTTVFLDIDPELFTVRISVSDDITELMGYDINVRFDSTKIKLVDVTEGTLPLNSGFETFFWWFDSGVPDNTAHINGAVLGNTVDGPGVLFDLVFEKAAVGTTYVELFGTEIRTGVNTTIPHSTVDGMVIVDKSIAVEPTTWGQVKEKFR
jgi:hypothetical protein